MRASRCDAIGPSRATVLSPCIVPSSTEASKAKAGGRQSGECNYVDRHRRGTVHTGGYAPERCAARYPGGAPLWVLCQGAYCLLVIAFTASLLAGSTEEVAVTSTLSDAFTATLGPGVTWTLIAR